MRARGRALTLVPLLAVVAPQGRALGQSVRVTGSSVLRYLELRPFVRDSVAQDSTDGEGLLRQLPDGRVVRCIPGEPFCHHVRPGDVASTVTATQDVEVSAWGFGEGAHLFAHGRGRAAWGEAAGLWPRADDAFDLLALYAELDRERYRVRAGRQWKVSGLGFYNFDGLALALRPAEVLWVEAYGGRSLVRGLNEPRTGGALETADALAPPNPGLLLGAHARYRPSPRVAVSALYQVDFRDDGRGVYSELVAADGVLRVGRGWMELAVEADAAAAALNQARLQLRSAPLGRVALHGELRRYRPYFELWTIWGAFSPVGFDEGRAGLTWADPAGRLIVRTEGAYRRYGERESAGATDELRNDGWGWSSSVSWSPTRAWRLEASYGLEAGFGAARRDGHAGVRRQFANGRSLALQGLVFQRLYEFRLEEGTVVGLGGEAVLPMSARTRLVAGAAVYRHLDGRGTSAMDWMQRRGTVRMEWTVGREPGARPPRSAVP